MDLVAAVAVLVVAALCGYRLLRRTAALRRWSLLLVVALAAVASLSLTVAVAVHRPAKPELEIEGRPIEVQPDGYVTSRACKSCHPGPYASWEASYHRTMTQVASPDIVVGDFDGTELALGDWVFRLEQDGDGLWVDMPEIDIGRTGPDGPRVRRKIALTTGSHHMQIYWYESGNSRALGMLPFLYNIKTDRWVPYESSFFRLPSGQPQSLLGRWNKTCIECHATQGRLRPTQPAGQDTHVAEFGIACEACHGPGAAHVAANHSVTRRYASHFSDEPDPYVVQPENLLHDRASEVCGQCHLTSIWTSQEQIDEWMQNGFPYRPGDRLADTKHRLRGKLEWNTATVKASLRYQEENYLINSFWPDGKNRLAGREFNDLSETPCYQRGELSCLTCHQMHKGDDDPRTYEEWRDDQLKPGMRGNLACTGCHGEYASGEALTAHTHHEEGSTGSLCYNCHMPFTTYGLQKGVRNHQIDNPSPASDVESGRPNACNLCHLDRTLEWTVETMERWYDEPRPALLPDHRKVAQSVLLALTGDGVQRSIVAWAMGWKAAHEVSGGDWEALYLALLLGDDPYPVVRAVAFKSVRNLEGYEGFDFDYLAPTDERHAEANRMIETWLQNRTSPPERSGFDELLLSADGWPRLRRLADLGTRRNDRPIVLH